MNDANPNQFAQQVLETFLEYGHLIKPPSEAVLDAIHREHLEFMWQMSTAQGHAERELDAEGVGYTG